MESNTGPDIFSAVHKCAWFTHNINTPHESAVKRICWYIYGTKDKGMVLNPSKIMVVDCYINSDLWGYAGNDVHQDTNYSKSRTVLLIVFSNYPLWWKTKVHMDIYLFALNSEYVVLYHSF